jgi:hypothetical protein
LRVIWYFRRITVRQSRCSASGTKLKVSSCATSRFTRRSASGKSCLRPPAPRFDCACARWSVPESGLAPSRVRRLGRQCCSSASHTGRQYCAVDSITTSSTSRSTSQSASACSSPGLVPTLRRSNWQSPSTSPLATTTANIFLCTSIPAILYGVGLSCRSGKRASSHQSGSQAVVGRQDFCDVVRSARRSASTIRRPVRRQLFPEAAALQGAHCLRSVGANEAVSW